MTIIRFASLVHRHALSGEALAHTHLGMAYHGPDVPCLPREVLALAANLHPELSRHAAPYSHAEPTLVRQPSRRVARAGPRTNRARFRLDEGRDYLAAEVIAAQDGSASHFDERQGRTASLENAAILAAGLTDSADGLLTALLIPARIDTSDAYRRWLAVQCALAARQTGRPAMRRLRRAVRAALPAVWAIEGLAALGDAAGAASRLPDWDVDLMCRSAVEPRWQVAAAPLARAVARRLRDGDVETRCAAATALPGLRAGYGAMTRRALVGALSDPDAGVRRLAAFALGEVRDRSPSVRRALCTRLYDQEPSVARAAAEALGRIGAAAGRGLAMLLTALRGRFADGDGPMRSRVAGALRRLGGITPELVTAVLADLDSQDAERRFWAVETLGSLEDGSPAVVAAVSAALHDPDPDVRQSAVTALPFLAEPTPELLALLADAVRDPDFGVRWKAIEALGGLGDGSELVADALRPLLVDDDVHIRWVAAEALVTLGHDLDGGLSTLLDVLQDPDPTVRWGGVGALRDLDSWSPAVQAALCAALADDDANVREEAAITLARFGEASDAVVAALWTALRDPAAAVARAAADALGRLARLHPPTRARLEAARDGGQDAPSMDLLHDALRVAGTRA